MTEAAAVFLDRDGVLNRTIERDRLPGSPRSLSQFVLFEDAPGAVASLRHAGYRIFVVTNQPDLARGKLEPAVLDAMMAELADHVPVDDWRVCPHDDADRCACRKPRPGMLLDLADCWGVALERSYMVGDMWRDVEAGRTAGCRTVLLRRDYNEGVGADQVCATLAEAAAWILDQP